MQLKIQHNSGAYVKRLPSQLSDEKHPDPDWYKFTLQQILFSKNSYGVNVFENTVRFSSVFHLNEEGRFMFN